MHMAPATHHTMRAPALRPRHRTALRMVHLHGPLRRKDDETHWRINRPLSRPISSHAVDTLIELGLMQLGQRTRTGASSADLTPAGEQLAISLFPAPELIPC